VAIPGENGLTVMQDQGDIPVFQRTEFQKEAIVFSEAQLLPLV